ncbi:MAG TPA: Rrf2 family transcriptional regulator [Xanthomonadales bacterium]|nr:Rrf2 family transcriptional regulator [Xanthomonadales bacterium]
MKLTRFTDYALRVLIYLGLRSDGRVTIREISEAYGISRNHLMKVVSNLTRLGYLDARRGPGGGLMLARPAVQIKLADVIRDVEEDMNLVSCFGLEGQCTIKPVCRLRDALREALSAYVHTLESYSLEDLLEPKKSVARLLHIS